MQTLLCRGDIAFAADHHFHFKALWGAGKLGNLPANFAQRQICCLAKLFAVEGAGNNHAFAVIFQQQLLVAVTQLPALLLLAVFEALDIRLH